MAYALLVIATLSATAVLGLCTLRQMTVGQPIAAVSRAHRPGRRADAAPSRF